MVVDQLGAGRRPSYREGTVRNPVSSQDRSPTVFHVERVVAAASNLAILDDVLGRFQEVDVLSKVVADLRVREAVSPRLAAEVNALIGVVVDAGTLDAIAGRTAGDVDTVADVSDHVPVVVRLDVGQLHALRADQADSALEARHLHVLQEAPRGLLGDHDATRVGSAAPADHMTAAVEGDRCDEA